jgi:hypothetical protein
MNIDEILQTVARLVKAGQVARINDYLAPADVITLQRHINSGIKGKGKIKEDGVFGTNTLNALQLSMDASGKNWLSDEDLGDSKVNAELARLAQTKGGMAKSVKEQTLQDINTFAGLGATGLRAAAAAQQLKQGNRGLANLQAPGPVAPQVTNRNLQGLIQKYSTLFNQGGDPAQAALQGQMNNQAYNDQLASLRNTGQAGLVAAGGQKAYLDRLRASQQIMAARRQEQQNYGQMLGGAIGQQISEAGNQVNQRMQNLQVRDMPLYDRQFNQFNAQRNAGLQGLDNQLNAVIPAAQNLGGYLIDKPNRKNTLEKYRRAK